jgi:biofilm PGA synthesis lipoprotein PgaB
MAMPYMEQADKPGKWLNNLVKVVKAQDNGLKKTVFILQTRDWRTKSRSIPEEEIASFMRQLQRQGAIHFGYYPDDFPGNRPSVDVLHPAFSIQDFIYRP